MENIDELNSILVPFDNTIFSKENFSKINSICARLAASISDIQGYVKYDFIEEEGIQIRFSKVKGSIIELNNQYNNMVTKDFKISNTGFRLLNKYLYIINGIPQYFVFDEKKIMKLYRDYIGKSIEKTVNESIKKNPRILAALIISIFSLVGVFIQILFSYLMSI